jgi:uncharacterized protein (TIGR02246 family)
VGAGDVDFEARRSSRLYRQLVFAPPMRHEQAGARLVALGFRSNTMENAADPVQQVLSEYKAAVFAKNVDAFVALYAQDVIVFDTWDAWSHSGVQPWRAAVTGWFESLGTDRVVVEFTDILTSLAPDLAVAHASVTYRAVTADGAPLRSMDNRLTIALKRKGAEWKIVHEHTSSPASSETTKISLKRALG